MSSRLGSRSESSFDLASKVVAAAEGMLGGARVARRRCGHRQADVSIDVPCLVPHMGRDARVRLPLTVLDAAPKRAKLPFVSLLETPNPERSPSMDAIEVNVRSFLERS
jgi:hypothetical protein